MKKGIYYIKELNCLCVIYKISEKDFLEKQTIKFSAAAFLNDSFTTISHYECNLEIFKRTFSPIKITEENYKEYLSLDNRVKSTGVKDVMKSYSFKFSTKFGLKSIERDDKVIKVRPYYDFIEPNNFGKQRVIKVIITSEFN